MLFSTWLTFLVVSICTSPIRASPDEETVVVTRTHFTCPCVADVTSSSAPFASHTKSWDRSTWSRSVDETDSTTHKSWPTKTQPTTSPTILTTTTRSTRPTTKKSTLSSTSTSTTTTTTTEEPTTTTTTTTTNPPSVTPTCNPGGPQPTFTLSVYGHPVEADGTPAVEEVTVQDGARIRFQTGPGTVFTFNDDCNLVAVVSNWIANTNPPSGLDFVYLNPGETIDQLGYSRLVCDVTVGSDYILVCQSGINTQFWGREISGNLFIAQPDVAEDGQPVSMHVTVVDPVV